MKPRDLVATLMALITTPECPAVMIWGPPGIGKSQIVAQVAATYGAQVHRIKTKGMKKKDLQQALVDLRLPLYDAVDLRGIPVDENGVTVWRVPNFLPQVVMKGIIFLDELPQAIPVVQSAASQLILDRRIGDYVLPEGWVVIAAGNRDTDRAATHRMPSHIANRFIHLNLEVDYEDWYAHAVDNGFHPAVIGFIGMRSELLHKFDPSEKAYPTPRSWEFVSKLSWGSKVPDTCFKEVIIGTVGQGAAEEYIGFFRVYRDMPEYEEIVERPTKAKVPDNAAAAYATSSMLAVRGKAQNSKAVFEYLNRMPKEFQIITARQIGKYNIDLAETQAYIQWQVANKDVYLNRPNAQAA